jgi:hypothetical protein
MVSSFGVMEGMIDRSLITVRFKNSAKFQCEKTHWDQKAKERRAKKACQSLCGSGTVLLLLKL